MMRVATRELSATRRTIVVSALMILAAAATAQLAPAPAPTIEAPDLDALLPDAFGAWRRVLVETAVLPDEVELGPGEAVAYRAYRDGAGRLVTLVVAYGPPLGDSVRLHRPEKCYVAQGYDVRSKRAEAAAIGRRVVELVRLETQSTLRREAVSYWLRAGADFTSADAESRPLSLDPAAARAPDGALVRVSSAGDAAQFGTHTEFLTAFVGALGPKAQALLLGSRDAS